MKIFEINIADILKNRRGSRNEMQLKTKIIISLVLGILSAAVLFYVFLPPINLMSESFWVYLTAVIAAFSLPFLKLGDGYVSVTEVNGRIKK